MRATNFGLLSILLLAFLPMIALAMLLTLINQVSGTPYITGGVTPAGTDCSGLASWVANAATDRPIFGNRFNTGNEEAALLQRGFQYGTAPDALVIGWNGGHTAVTLPDGTSVSSGEHGGVHIGGPGAYRRGFTHHMFLSMPPDGALPPPDAAPVLSMRWLPPRLRRMRLRLWPMLRLPKCPLRRRRRWVIPQSRIRNNSSDGYGDLSNTSF